MFRGTDRKKRNRAAACVLETLDDRVVLSASAAGAATAASGVVARYQAAVVRLQTAGSESRLDQTSTLIQRRTAQFDSRLWSRADRLRREARRRSCRGRPDEPGAVDGRDHPRGRSVRESRRTGE